MKIAPFELGHLDGIKPGKAEAPYFNKQTLIDTSPTWKNSAVSVVDGDKVLGIAAWLSMDGVVDVSFLMSDELRAKPMFLHRNTLRWLDMLRDAGAKSIDILCDESNEVSMRWLKRMGFKKTGNRGVLLGVEMKEYSLCL